MTDSRPNATPPHPEAPSSSSSVETHNTRDLAPLVDDINRGDDARLEFAHAKFGVSGIVRNIVVYIFAFYAILIPGVLLPVLAPLSLTKRGLLFMRFLIGAWMECFILIFGIDVVVAHRERINVDGPILIVANHRSWLDVIALMTVLKPERRVVYMMKRGLLRIPLFGWYMSLMRCVPVERGEKKRDNVAQIDRAVASVKSGEALVIFPEGTRTKSHEFGRFKRGAAEVAVGAEATVLPVVISGTAPLFPRGTPFVRPGRMRVEFLPPIKVTKETKRDALTASLFDSMSRRYRLTADAAPAEDDEALLNALRREARTSAHTKSRSD